MLNERKNNMKLTKQNAQLQLFKVNRQIEKKVAEHTNELGKYNKEYCHG